MRIILLTILFFLPGLGLASHHPEAFISTLKNDPKAPEKIYQKYCITCHSKNPIIPLGAPAFRENQDWAPRLQQGKKTVIEHLLNGIRGMPARGGCFECSDELLIQTLDYLLPKKG